MRVLTYLGCLLTFSVMLVLPGCGGSGGSQSAYVFVVDFSGSTAGVRRQQLAAVLVELENAPQSSDVVIYRTGYQTEEVFSGRLDETSVDSIVRGLDRDVSGSDSRPGTDLSAMAEALANFSRSYSGARYRVHILTDGYDDFAGDRVRQEMSLGAWRAVASDERLESVVFQGVKPGMREGLRALLAPLGHRLSFRDQDQLPD